MMSLRVPHVPSPMAERSPPQSQEYAVDVRALRRHRDRAADGFRASAVLADEVAARMFERLEMVRLPAGEVLDFGCADGVWTERLRARYPDRQVFGLDPALRLCRAAGAAGEGGTRWWQRWSRPATRVVCADLDALPFRRETLALVWSNLTVHWLARPERTWRQLGALLRPGGLLTFSTFGPDTLREIRQLWRDRPGEPPLLPLADMHNVGDALVQAGFTAPVMDMEMITLTYPDFAAFVADLRGQGATDARPGRPKGLASPRAWARFAERFESLRVDGRTAISFEIVQGHAWWPEGGARKTTDGRDIVRIHGLGTRGVGRPGRG